MSLNVSLMGIKGGGQFYASLKYSDLETKEESAVTARNEAVSSVGGNVTARNEAVSSPVTDSIALSNTIGTQSNTIEKNAKRLEALLNKEKLTTREAYKAAKLMEAQAASDEEKRQKRSLEVAPRESLVRITHDSLALLRDSEVWAG